MWGIPIFSFPVSRFLLTRAPGEQAEHQFAAPPMSEYQFAAHERAMSANFQFAAHERAMSAYFQCAAHERVMSEYFQLAAHERVVSVYFQFAGAGACFQ